MAAKLSPIGNLQQWFSNTGAVLAGGKIFTYLAGTSTLSSTFTDSTGTVANPNPIILGANGRFSGAIWLTEQVTYKFEIKDSSDNLIATIDNISGINDVQLTSVTPAGTIMLFPQTTVPTGWTRITTNDDAAIRVVGSAVPGTGGVNGFVSKLVNQITIDSHALTLAQMPSHTHIVPFRRDNSGAGGSNMVLHPNTVPGPTLTTTATGSATGHSHTVTLSVKFLDVMVCSKN